MKHDTKLMITAVGFFGALGALAYWGVKRAQAATPPAQQPQPQAIPAAAAALAVPVAPAREVQVSPGPAAPADVPPEQWTQQDASDVTAYQGNEARDAVGKVFGF